MTKLIRIFFAGAIGYLTSCAITYCAHADSYTAGHVENLINRDKISIAVMSQTYRKCMSYWYGRGERYSQAGARCSCEGDYALEYARTSMTESQLDQVSKSGKEACGLVLARATITEN